MKVYVVFCSKLIYQFKEYSTLKFENLQNVNQYKCSICLKVKIIPHMNRKQYNWIAHSCHNMSPIVLNHAPPIIHESWTRTEIFECGHINPFTLDFPGPVYTCKNLTTCWQVVSLTNKLVTTCGIACYKPAHKLSTRCVCTACSNIVGTSWWQVVVIHKACWKLFNKLLTICSDNWE